MTFRVLLLVVAAGLFGPAASASATTPQLAEPVQGGIGIRLLEAPAELADDPRAQTYVIDHVAPGTRVERDLEVSNDTSDAVMLELYASAAQIVADAFVPADPDAPSEVVSWTTVTPSQVTLEPGGRATATMVIAVPADASGGERYGALFVERPPPPDVPEGQVGVAARVGVRIYLSVGAGGAPPIDFALEQLAGRREADGTPVVGVLARNIGGRAVDLVGELTLSNGPGGLSAGPVPIEAGTTVAPGGEAVINVRLDPALPDGPWTARMVLRSGLVERTAEGEVTFTAGATGPTEAATDAAGAGNAGGQGADGDERVDPLTEGGRLPALVIAAVLLLLVLVALFLALFRRRESRRRQSPPPQTT